MKNAIDTEEMTASATIEDSFSGIVEQHLAKEKLQLALHSVEKGNEMRNFLLLGEAGLGKTALARAMQSAYESLGFGSIWFDSAKEFRSKGEAFSTLLQAIMEPDSMGEKGCVVFIDEVHLINETPTVQTRAVKEFLMKFADGNNIGKTVRVGEEITVNVNRKTLSFVLMTNFPAVLDKSGAFQSRMDKIELDLYTPDGLIEILNIQLEKAGLKDANEETLRLIANTGRGTARPMEKIVGQLKDIVSKQGKKTINRRDVLDAMRLARVYPLGASVPEIRLLNRCTQGAERDAVLLSLLNMEPKSFRNTKSFLLGLQLVASTTQGLATTGKGIAYLTQAREEKFNVDL